MVKIIIYCIFMAIAAKAEVKMISIDEEVNWSKNWYLTARNDEQNIKFLIDILAKSTVGKKILENATKKAAIQGMTLTDVLNVGEGSLTDTTLLRKFSPERPEIVMVETRSKVFINRHLSTIDAVLDFAHELTHYTWRQPFNPYELNFTLKEFIASTVEGVGGEVDAYLNECRVQKELLGNTSRMRSYCDRVYDPLLKDFSRSLGINEFYKVGRHYREWRRRLDQQGIADTEFKKVTEDDATFISSAWGVPYPVAAIYEYTNIMDRVCANDAKRISLMKTQNNYVEDFNKRCPKFSQN